jgi:hypothetical protein
MAEGAIRLSAALVELVQALDTYLGDEEESGCDSYDLNTLVPMPLERPAHSEPQAVWAAWGIKAAVVAGGRSHPEPLAGYRRVACQVPAIRRDASPADAETRRLGQRASGVPQRG